MDLKESRVQSHAQEGEWYDDVRFALLHSITDGNPPERALDFGCGAGGLSSRMASRTGCRVTGYDPALTDTEIARLAELGVTATASTESLEHQTFDLVLLMDVLEHVDDPAGLLADACSYVRPRGRLVITVPAYRWLWSSHDVSLGHVDRYTKPRLQALCRSAGTGFRTTASGYAFPSLLAGAAPVRTFERIKRGNRRPDDVSQMADESPGMATALRKVATSDVRAVGCRSPFGLTCVQVMERAGP